MKESDRLEIILEEVRGQYQAIQEGIDGLQLVPQRLDRLEETVGGMAVKTDLVVDAIQDYGQRLEHLEAGS